MSGRDRTGTALGARMPARGRSAPCLFALVLAAAAGLAVLLAAPAHSQAARDYRFTKVADSAEDNLDPASFGCPAINDRGGIAFRAGRLSPDGFDAVDGIYRVNAKSGRLVTIAEDGDRFRFIGRNPSINNGGEVSFAANLRREDPQTGANVEKIFRGDARGLTGIASTANRFNFFGFDTSLNDLGRVAFHAELDEDFDQGLFSGRGGDVRTHYLASSTRFAGSFSGPSINNRNDIAFEDRLDNAGRTQVIYVVYADGRFEKIAEADPEGFVGDPVINDAGTVAFENNFVDADGTFVTAIVTGKGGPLSTVADTRGRFGSFGFAPPSLNNDGDVAFAATLDDFETTGIFVKTPNGGARRVITTGETLNGSTVQNLVFCEEGLSNTDRLAFAADLEDPGSPEGFRTAIFRAKPATLP